MGSPVNPTVAPWKDVIGDTPLTYLEAVTPPASLATLIGLNAFVHWSLSGPYAVTALSADTEGALDNHSHWMQRIGPGCAFLRARFHLGVEPSLADGITPDLSAFSSSSGVGVNDEILVQSEINGKLPATGGAFGPQEFEILGAEVFDEFPTAPTDRLYEIFNAEFDATAVTDKELPYTEGFHGTGMHGMSGLWNGERDMNDL